MIVAYTYNSAPLNKFAEEKAKKNQTKVELVEEAKIETTVENLQEELVVADPIKRGRKKKTE